MTETGSKHWVVGLPLVQWEMITQGNRGIGEQMPYRLLTGQNPRVGISNLPLGPALIQNLRTEAELCALLALPEGVPLEDAIIQSYSSVRAAAEPPTAEPACIADLELPSATHNVFQESPPFPANTNAANHIPSPPPLLLATASTATASGANDIPPLPPLFSAATSTAVASGVSFASNFREHPPAPPAMETPPPPPIATPVMTAVTHNTALTLTHNDEQFAASLLHDMEEGCDDVFITHEYEGTMEKYGLDPPASPLMNEDGVGDGLKAASMAVTQPSPHGGTVPMRLLNEDEVGYGLKAASMPVTQPSPCGETATRIGASPNAIDAATSMAYLASNAINSTKVNHSCAAKDHCQSQMFPLMWAKEKHTCKQCRKGMHQICGIGRWEDKEPSELFTQIMSGLSKGARQRSGDGEAGAGHIA